MSTSHFTQAAKEAPVTIRSHEISLPSLRSVVEALSRDSIRLNIPKAEQGKATGSVSRMIGWFKKADAEVGTIPGLRKSEVILKFDANLSPPKSVAEWRKLEAVIKQVLDTKLTELKPGRTPWIKPAEPVTVAAIAAVETVTPAAVAETAAAETSKAVIAQSQQTIDLSLLRLKLAGAEARAISSPRQLSMTPKADFHLQWQN